MPYHTLYFLRLIMFENLTAECLPSNEMQKKSGEKSLIGNTQEFMYFITSYLSYTIYALFLLKLFELTY